MNHWIDFYYCDYDGPDGKCSAMQQIKRPGPTPDYRQRPPPGWSFKKPDTSSNPTGEWLTYCPQHANAT